MNKLTSFKQTILIAAIGGLSLLGTSSFAGDNLAEVITATGWNKIIGTWIDPETNGEKNRSTFSWKYQGTVLESITEMPDKETISIFGRDPKTGDAYVFSADSLGGRSNGAVKFTKGLAVFNIEFMSHEEKGGNLEIQYKLIDDDNMTVTFVQGEPVTIKLVREKK